MTQDLANRLSPIGRIVLYFYFIEHLEAVGPVEVPQLASNEFDVLSEKALHKAAAMHGDQLSHQTRYVLSHALQGIMIADMATSLTAPEQRDTITYNEVKTTENEPFATFTFYYRSTGQSYAYTAQSYR